jgi:hypothetical protein
MKILHIILDGKAISRLAPNLEKITTLENRYVVLDGRPNPSFQHISNLTPWRIVGRDYLVSAELDEDMRWAEVLIVHWLQPLSAEIALRAPQNMPIVWSGWGGDYYSLLPGGMGALISEETSRLINKSVEDKASRWIRLGQLVGRLTFKNIVWALKYRIRNRVLKRQKAEYFIDAFIKRVDFFSAPIQDDYAILRKSLGEKFKAEYLQINYADVEQVTKSWNVELTGNNILLGNSATPTNNHAEMLMMLAEMNIGDRKVIVPLNYGDQEYAERVVEMGKQLLGDCFYPLLEFISLGEYNKLLSGCSVAIMNHRRQQALGNAIIMLYMGAKLFLDEEGVVYKFFKNKGAVVFSIQNIRDMGMEAFAPVSSEERQKNRDVLESVWGEAVVAGNYLKAIHRLEVFIHENCNAH